MFPLLKVKIYAEKLIYNFVICPSTVLVAGCWDPLLTLVYRLYSIHVSFLLIAWCLDQSGYVYTDLDSIDPSKRLG
jgi:hypothetical protein